MTMHILICDDSTFAQKQMARALPDDWDVQIAFAGNGLEGMTALKQGKGEVVFLDLNMPEMDGYGVLQNIRTENLSSKVIVVSGDIQPDAYRRVMELGALEFIKKPVDREEIIRVLDKCGLRQQVDTKQPAEIDVSIFDGYKEIANVAMGRAADLLARLLDCFVIMPIPIVNVLEVSELRMMLENVDENASISAVCQGFIGNGIAGEALLIFHEASFTDIAELMKHEGDIDDLVQQELLMDMASILIGALLKGIADQLDTNFSQSHPTVLGQHVKINDLIKRGAGRWKKTLTIELGYAIEDRNIKSDLLLLFTEDSIPRLTELVSYVME